MIKLIFLIIAFLLLIPITFSGVVVEYSEDNLTWQNVTNVDETVKDAYQIALKKDTDYYIKGRNSTFSTRYLFLTTLGAEEAEPYYLYILVFLISIGLLWAGYYLDDIWIHVMLGILICVMALNISMNNTFVNWSVDWFRQLITIVLLGIGFYYIVMPFLKFFEEGGVG